MCGLYDMKVMYEVLTVRNCARCTDMCDRGMSYIRKETRTLDILEHEGLTAVNH
jgi:hypothetical protein